MRSRLLLLPALALCVQATTADTILDLLWDWGDDSSGLEQRDTQASSSAAGGDTGSLRKCSCEGPACDCCVDFNLTFIDLGGPGCVRMKYVSPEDGIAVNVSYGDSLLHSESVKGANPGPTCMGMLSDLAQLCARFVDLAPTADGLRWCLQIEPTLLGEVQAEYHVGCFRMAPGGMALDPSYNYTRPAAPPSTEAPDELEPADTTDQSEEEALLAAVSQSAEQGIAFFSNLLGLAVGEGQANTTSLGASSSSTTTTPGSS